MLRSSETSFYVKLPATYSNIVEDEEEEEGNLIYLQSKSFMVQSQGCRLRHSMSIT